MEPEPPTPTPKQQRLVSLDVYRGFIMMALVSSYFAVGLWSNGTRFETFFDYQLSHAPWGGCTIWDLIQPSFMFIVGVAMPFSYASRKAKGDSDSRLFLHALKRAIILILLGVFLRSTNHEMTYWTFEDVISQIGLGYIFVFLTLGKGIKVQATVTVAILVGYWLLFALWPLPATGYTPFPNNNTHWQYFSDFSAHWNKGANPLGYFDAWFLNLFPRSEPWTFHPGGYGTLNFIPSMATILFGVMAGEYMCSNHSIVKKCQQLAVAGILLLMTGMLLDGHIWPGVNWDWSIVPIVKRIWTPSFTIFSTGWTLLILSAFVLIIDIWGFKKWAFPFIIVGLNPLTIYVMEGLLMRWLRETYQLHFNSISTNLANSNLVIEAFVIGTMWGILYWMYRRKIFIRI